MPSGLDDDGPLRDIVDDSFGMETTKEVTRLSPISGPHRRWFSISFEDVEEKWERTIGGSGDPPNGSLRCVDGGKFEGKGLTDR